MGKYVIITDGAGASKSGSQPEKVSEFIGSSVEDVLGQYHREVMSDQRADSSVRQIVCPDGEVVIPWPVTDDFPLPTGSVVRWEPFDGMYWITTAHEGELDNARREAAKHGVTLPELKR